jgi:hypothetical protein
MKKSNILIAGALLLASVGVSAAEVVEVREDRAVGGGFGGLSGFMLGAAVGGPVGALVGGGIGWFAGQQAQGAAGLEHNLYVIKGEDGSISTVRSSAEDFAQRQGERDGAQLAAVAR